MKRAIAALTLTGALAAPGSALAADVNISGAKTVRASLAIAQAYWHQAPAECPRVSVLGAVTDEPVQGWTWMPTDQRPEGTPACAVWVNLRVMREFASIAPELRVEEICRTVVHEYGHKLGLDHEPHPADPARVMDADVAVFKPCERYAWGVTS